jgi:hypothetical protein
VFSGYFSHLFAVPPDPVALEQFGLKLGLISQWFQRKKNPVECHWDVTESKRELAIQLGAVPVTVREGARLRIEWKQQNPMEVNSVATERTC